MNLSQSKLLAPLRYSIPGNPETDEYLLPVSGGVDSTALVILLHEQAPHIPFRMVFTDTGAEEEETLETLDRLERLLGKPIERLGEKGLFELIDDFNGFLPSPVDRYCTRLLKLVPFQEWLQQFAGKTKWMFIGIRADEASRLAFTLPEVETVMPFIDLGINREWVYQKLSETVGIPKSYQTRSRSGCTVCPYQRTSELVGLLQRSPDGFSRGAQCEKLNPVDAARHAEGIPFWKDSLSSPNWQSMPMPLSHEEIQAGRLAKAPDLFGARIFVGGEFFMDGFASPDDFVWAQRLVCFSSTLAGVKKQLDGRYQHLLSTSEVYEMTKEDVQEKVKFAIWYIELPSSVFDPTGIKGTGEDRSYTWHQGKSYRQIRHIVQWSLRVLHAEFARQEAATRDKVPLLSVQYEWSEDAQQSLDTATAPLGNVLLSQWYRASEKVVEPESEEEVLRQLPCPMCHL